MTNQHHDNPIILSSNDRLSESSLWRLQRQFFNQEGVNAWREEVVPQYITSNPHIAHAYARTIFGWLRDVAETLDTSQPLYIVELGAGSGRLAYHILKAFWSFFESSPLGHIPVTYVLTDFAQSTVDFWTRHPQLQPWVDAGKLDFALFDAESSTSLHLIKSDLELSADTLKNPVVFIANYFFDGLRQDVFRLQYGDLQESLVTLSAPPDADIDDPAILDQLEIRYQHRPIQSDYYDVDVYNQLLGSYQHTLDRTHLVFPVGSLDCLGRLLDMTNRQMFMLTGDKGYHLDHDLESRGEPTIKMHGSFSMMVNYHAIGAYVKANDGHFLTTDHHHASLDMCAMLFGDMSDTYPETHYAYQRDIVDSSPDDMYTLKAVFEDEDDLLDVHQILAYLRLQHWDSDTFLDVSPMLLDVAEDVDEKIRRELRRACQMVWERYYDIGEEYDLAGEIGRLLYALDYPEEAIYNFEQSIRVKGKDATILYNIAMCYFEIDDLAQAHNYILQSLDLAPDFEMAQELEAQITRARHDE